MLPTQGHLMPGDQLSAAFLNELAMRINAAMSVTASEPLRASMSMAGIQLACDPVYSLERTYDITTDQFALSLGDCPANRTTIVRITNSTGGQKDIAGIEQSHQGRAVVFWNIGPDEVEFLHDSASATANENKILIQGEVDVTLAEGDCILAWYLEADQRWRATTLGSSSTPTVTIDGVLSVGCGLTVADNVLLVDSGDLAGAGLLSSGGCALEVNVGCGLAIDGDAVIVYAPDLAGAGLVASGTCGLAVNVGCGLEIVNNTIVLEPADIAGAGLTTTTVGCEIAVLPGCGTFIDGDGALAFYAPDAAGPGLASTDCELSLDLGCGLQFDGNAVAINAPAIAGNALDVADETCVLDVQVDDCGIIVNEDNQLALDLETILGPGLENPIGCQIAIDTTVVDTIRMRVIRDIELRRNGALPRIIELQKTAVYHEFDVNTLGLVVAVREALIGTEVDQIDQCEVECVPCVTTYECAECDFTPCEWGFVASGFIAEDCQFDKANGTWTLAYVDTPGSCEWSQMRGNGSTSVLTFNSGLSRWELMVYPVNPADTSYLYTKSAASWDCCSAQGMTFASYGNDDLICSSPSFYPGTLTLTPVCP